jgi:hypothetical protein
MRQRNPFGTRSYLHTPQRIAEIRGIGGGGCTIRLEIRLHQLSDSVFRNGTAHWLNPKPLGYLRTVDGQNVAIRRVI